MLRNYIRHYSLCAYKGARARFDVISFVVDVSYRLSCFGEENARERRKVGMGDLGDKKDWCFGKTKCYCIIR